MKCKLKIIDPTGAIVSEVKYKIPFAKSISGQPHYRNFLEIGNYLYHMKADGEFVSILPDKIISDERMAEIRALHANKVAQLNKSYL